MNFFLTLLCWGLLVPAQSYAESAEGSVEAVPESITTQGNCKGCKVFLGNGSHSDGIYDQFTDTTTFDPFGNGGGGGGNKAPRVRKPAAVQNYIVDPRFLTEDQKKPKNSFSLLPSSPAGDYGSPSNTTVGAPSTSIGAPDTPLGAPN